MRPRVVEVLVREQEVKRDCMRPKTTMLAHTGYITFLRKL
jgi:tRNA (adenine57-N1/adenine58-N1)-methyltransferase